MALNPNFEQQANRKLPLAFGFVLGAGDPQLSTIGQDGNAYQCYILGEGEWDGPEGCAYMQGGHIAGIGGTDSGNLQQRIHNAPDDQKETFARLFQSNLAYTNQDKMHFHAGRWATKGIGNTATSVGAGVIPDFASAVLSGSQSCDGYLPNFPTVTPAQTFSGMAYTVFKLVPSILDPYDSSKVIQLESQITGIGLYRGIRCRTFDVYGNVVSYAFTINPAWQIVEAILRYKIKPQQCPLAGLTAQEKACFDWPSVVAFAQRNAFVLPNGDPRFFYCGVFAAEATLTNILETLLRCSRAYILEKNGKIYLMGDDPRASVFTLSANHEYNNSLRAQKKDIYNAPNQFVARYRDMGIPAVARVTNAYGTTDGSGLHTIYFSLDSLSPFLFGDLLTYRADPLNALCGDFVVVEPADSSGNYSYVPNQALVLSGVGQSSGSFSGGYVGSADARFAEREVSSVQHRAHQLLVANGGPGFAVQPKVRPVYYDMGNSTFDQTNRIMKFERDSLLGPDVSPSTSYVAPIGLELTALFEAVDAQGRYLKDIDHHDIVTVDDWLFPEAPGDYVVQNRTITTTASTTSPATVELELYPYFPSAYTDVSDPPDDAYLTLPYSNLLVGGEVYPAPNPAYTLQATPHGVQSGSAWTITIPDLTMHLLGSVSPTTYPSFSVSGVPNASPVVLYVNDNGAGTVSFGWQSFGGPDSSISLPANRYIVLVGSFDNGLSTSDPSVRFSPS